MREIGSRSFESCGCLSRVEIRSRKVTIAKDAFSGSTPVGAKVQKSPWTTGPTVLEVKGDPQFEYARNGRMQEPLFSFGYGDIRFGMNCGDIGGWGSTTMRGHQSLGEFDVHFLKVGPGQLAGVIVEWKKRRVAEGTVDDAKQTAERLISIIEDKLGGKINAPSFLPKSEWPEFGDRGSPYAEYAKIKPVATSETEVNGYSVIISMYGGKRDTNEALVVVVADRHMLKTWGGRTIEEVDRWRKGSVKSD